MSYILVIINAIVVALMAVYINVNERRFHEMSTSHDRTGQYIENMVRNLTVDISDDIRRISDEQIAEKGQYIENMVRNLTVDISDDIRRISDEQIAEKVQNIENVVRILTVGISDDIRRISNEQIAEKGKKKNGFLVRLKGSLENQPKGSDVIYDDVITNDGVGYNPSTGIFTASDEGLYSFSWTTTTQGHKNFFTYLAVNGNMIARNHAQSDTLNSSASQTVVVHLKTHDKVNIKVHDDYVGLFILSEGWSTFSGFMI
ncbi:complement C1q-like protein 2 isoform X2 [Mytilus edulis]|uniref:complement C1q-like protein 2 isoform X2 n=1 Tax=Mytilus edulis TaxID=6550 RepID=UPI0039EFAE3A